MSVRWTDTVLVDLRFAARLIAKNPAVTTAIVTTLALSIGTSSAMFAVLDATVLRPLPVPESNRLVWITSVRSERSDAPFSLPEFLDYQSETRSLEGLSAYSNWSANLTGGGDGERLQGLRLSANAFEVLGVSAAAGRLLRSSDDRPGAEAVVVISYGLWQRRFGARSDTVGQVLRLNAEPYTVVGVLPRTFTLPIRDIEVIAPLNPDRDPRRGLRNSTNFLRFFGRLRRDASAAQAQFEMTEICKALRERYPKEYAAKLAVRVVPLQTAISGEAGRILGILLGAILIVVAVACANLANVLLLRTIPRLREMAIRAANGATTGRLLQQIVTETVVLALLGAGGGILVAVWALSALVTMAPAEIPRLPESAINGRALLFVGAVSVFLASGLALVPALHVRRSMPDLLRLGRGTIGGRGQQLLRTALVSLEVASAVVLLVAGGALARSWISLQQVDRGFQPSGVFVARVSLPASRYRTPTQISAFVNRLASTLAESPGVDSVAAISVAPFSGLLASVNFYVVGEATAASETPDALFRVVTPGYFTTIGTRLVQGRLFTADDRSNTRLVAIVNESLARRANVRASPLGERISINDADGGRREATVVGVIADTRESRLEQPSVPIVYLPMEQMDPSGVTWVANNHFWVIRTTGSPGAFEREFRTSLNRADSDAATSNARPLEEYIVDSLATRRFNTVLMIAFACAASLVAALGLYTVVSYSVRQRSGELAVRVALGATPTHLRTLVVSQALRPVVLGWCIGGVLSVAASRALASMMFETSMTDWPVLAAASIATLVIAGSAVLVPAGKAGSIRPLEALRTE